jgi:hypothetical protein
MRSFLLLLLALLLMVPPRGAVAQPPVEGDGSSREARAEIFRFLNDPATLRMAGGGRIPGGSRVEAPVGVLGGPLLLAGTIAGDLVVVNGDLVVEAGGRVEGNVTVVGGSVRNGRGEPWVGGTLRLDPLPLRYRIRGERIEAEPSPTPDLPGFLVADVGLVQLRPLLRSDGAYNRVEGFPVELGGSLQSRSRNPLRLEAAAIWRSASGLEMDRDNLGYSVRVEQSVGGRDEARMGFVAHRRISAIESRDLSNLEAGLSTFFLRRDLRDHYAREGWTFYLEGSPLDLPLRPRFEYQEEDHASVAAGDPWTLGGADRPWRPQPAVAEGAVRTLAFRLLVDNRDDPGDPSSGWWIEGGLRRQVGGTPRLSSSVAAGAGEFPLATDGHLDLRRYARLGPEARWNARFLVLGSVNRTPLLPQHQRSLGGEGTLPGHPRFALDCGARARSIPASGGSEAGGDGAVPVPVFPAYGCDGVALVRLEFEGRLPFSWSPGLDRPDWEMASLLTLRPAWSVFVGAGRGWSYEDPDDSTGMGPRTDAPFRADMGVGVFVGPLGVYWAWPLNRRDRGVNFFVRFSHLF